MPNKIIYSIMTQLKKCNQINSFRREYTIENSKKNMPYDMMFITNNGDMKLIEMDSNLHSYIKMKHGKRGIQNNTLYNDSIKDDLAYKNNIELIRIDCFKNDIEYIKSQLLSSRLNELVDFSIIDWDKVLEFTCNNLVKQVCEYKKIIRNVQQLL